MYKKGDFVSVFSLQSFFDGGFLYDESAIVKQDQYGKSVIIMVVRNIGGRYRVDYSYEVYAEQLKLIKSFESFDKRTKNKINKIFDSLKNQYEVSNESQDKIELDASKVITALCRKYTL